MKRIVIATCVVTLLILVLTTGSPLTAARAQKGNKYQLVAPPGKVVPGRVLVKFREGIMPDHARNIIAALGARDADEIPSIGVHVLDLPDQADEAGFAQAMAERPEVEFAELDRILRPAAIVPNDPFYANWEWHLPKIQAPLAWSSTTGNSSVTIAVIDSGADGTHEDLATQLVPGWNIYNNNSNTTDLFGHGTAVSGTIAAASNNGVGVASVCWGCKIMPIRVIDASGYTTYSAVASGVTWAANHGARVANISFQVTDSSTVKSALQYFQSKGGVATIPSGNDGTFVSSADNPYALTLGATDQFDVLHDYSTRGNNVDLVAPGEAFTTRLGGGYISATGTCYSSAIAAGVAGLVISANPSLTPTQVQDILKQSADDLGPAGWDSGYGWGRINASRAVSMALGLTADTIAPTVSFSSLIFGETVSGVVTIQISASDNVGVSSVRLSVDGVSVGTNTASPYQFQWDTTLIPNGSHTLTATAMDAAGNASNASVTVNVSNSVAVDSSPPAIVIASPLDNSKISINVSVYVNASDNIGVTRVELYVDGVLTSSSSSAPFTTKWNSRKALTGPHTLQSKAYDAAGNSSLSQSVTVRK
jgi:thermitase